MPTPSPSNSTRSFSMSRAEAVTLEPAASASERATCELCQLHMKQELQTNTRERRQKKMKALVCPKVYGTNPKHQVMYRS